MTVKLSNCHVACHQMHNLVQKIYIKMAFKFTKCLKYAWADKRDLSEEKENEDNTNLLE